MNQDPCCRSQSLEYPIATSPKNKGELMADFFKRGKKAFDTGDERDKRKIDDQGRRGLEQDNLVGRLR